MRSFIALELPVENLDYSKRIMLQLQKFISGRFVSEFNIHLTLAFLGEVDTNNIAQLSAIIDEISEKSIPCDISMQKLILLQNGSIIAIELKRNEQLMLLQQNLNESLKKAGFFTENRFRPHITLARKVNYEQPFREICKCVTIYNRPHFANVLSLYSSTLNENGATYELLYSKSIEEKQTNE
ncbi:MAG: RNA 2',3'-cyclic phosphodiesterase [Clostridia bacterium]